MLYKYLFLAISNKLIPEKVGVLTEQSLLPFRVNNLN